jgi:hypothetical protein
MDRMTQLEDAHRALAAQHTALMEFVRAILPLIPLPAEQLQKALVQVYDGSNAHMDAAVMDVGYQAEVRKWLDVLSDAASAGDKFPARQKDRN